MAKRTAIVNMSFDGYQYGEVVVVDDELFADYLDRGWLSEVDDEGRRIIPLDDTFVRLPANDVDDGDGEAVPEPVDDGET